MQANQKPPTIEVSHADLMPIGAWLKANHGSATQLANRISLMTSTRVTRQSVSAWLTDDRKKWQEPKHGMAILIKEAYKELVSEAAAEQAR